MKNYIIDKLKDYSKSNDKIKALFYVKENNNNEHFAEVYLVMKDIIISKIKEDLEKIFDDYVLINKKKDSFKIEKRDQQFTKFEVFTFDSSKIVINIVLNDLLDEFMSQIKGNIEYVYDEIELSQKISENKIEVELPKEYEFDNSCQNFFSLALDTSFSLLERDKISSGYKMQALRDELYKLLNWYVIDKYNNGLDAGEFGKNFIHTLEADLKEQLIDTFNSFDIEQAYTAIFKACQLYRKIGMEFANKYSFTYPKRDDVYALKLLRKNYKKMESLMV